MDFVHEKTFFNWLKGVLKYDEGLDTDTFERVWLEALVKQYKLTGNLFFEVASQFTKTGEGEKIPFDIVKGEVIVF